jgi:hypothetical protein
MMRAKIEAIVRQVVQNYLQATSSKISQRKLFIVLDYESPTPDLVWEKIKSISSRHKITLCLSDRWMDVPDRIIFNQVIQLNQANRDRIKEAMQQTDIVLFPTASYSLLSKLALTIDDELALWIAIQMQLDGKDIIIASDQIEHRGIRHISAPATVLKRIQGYIRQVQTDGVVTGSLDKIEQWLESSSRFKAKKPPLILARHMEEIANAGEKELTVPEQSLITPMGRDKARELGITIKKDIKLSIGKGEGHDH